MDDYRLQTPEQVDISYMVAGFGTRFIALAIDTLIQAVLLWVLIYSLNTAYWYNDTFQEWYTAICIVAFAVICYGYFLVFELLMKGKTPGKAAAKIKVVRMDGQAVDTAGIILRNLVRIVDFLPVLYAVGACAMFINKDSRRLGDLVAGTVVIVQRRQATLNDILSAQYPVASNTSLTNQEYAVIRDFIARRERLTPEARGRLAVTIALPLYNKMGTPVQDRKNPEEFLCKLIEWPAPPNESIIPQEPV